MDNTIESLSFDSEFKLLDVNQENGLLENGKSTEPLVDNLETNLKTNGTMKKEESKSDVKSGLLSSMLDGDTDNKGLFFIKFYPVSRSFFAHDPTTR